jgi:Hint domain
VACFTTGTFITTLKGEKPVEDLQPGDRVITRDNGLQTVRRIDRRDFDYGQLSEAPQFAPVLVTIGAMGPGIPEREMLVSPQLRLLAQHDHVPYGTNRTEALVAAETLNDGRTIRSCHALGVRYVHVVLDKHEVILANGIWAEAFQAHDPSLGGGVEKQTAELAMLFPALAGDTAADETALSH